MKSIKKSAVLFTIALTFALTFAFGLSCSHAQQPISEEVAFFDGELVSDKTPEPIQCGTKVNFIEDNEIAFAEAKRTGKLVYMIHLSGNLKNSDFT